MARVRVRVPRKLKVVPRTAASNRRQHPINLVEVPRRTFDLRHATAYHIMKDNRVGRQLPDGEVLTDGDWISTTGDWANGDFLMNNGGA